MLRAVPVAVLVLSGVAVPSGAAIEAPPGSSARARSAAPTVTPRLALPRERVTVSGRVDRTRRPVVLQRRHQGRWARVAAVKQGPRGYRFLQRPATTTRLRVLAPAWTSKGHRHPAQVSRARVVRVRQPTVTVGGARQVAVGQPLDLPVQVSPARAGRVVHLDTPGSRTSARTDARGRVSFRHVPQAVGRAALSVVVPPWRGTPAAPSAAAVVDVVPRAAPVVVAPVAGEVLVGTATVVVSLPDPAGEAPVRVFADGLLLGVAEHDGGGRYRLEWDTTVLPDGGHDLVARTGGPHGRLGAGVAVTVDNPDQDQGLPAGFGIDVVAAGFDLPSNFAAIDRSNVLVSEKDGRVRLVRDGVVAPTPVLDLRGRIATEGDLGLVALAIDPDFAANGWLYLSYVPETSRPAYPSYRSQVISRYTVEDGVADPESEVRILGDPAGVDCSLVDNADVDGCIPLVGAGHSVDDLVFEADGDLLVSLGDGTIYWGVGEEAMRSQDLDVLAGKVLRIDPTTGEGVPANPYFDEGDPAANRSRVVASGLRNPFRMTIEPGGAVVVTDVGGSDFEEVDRIVPGGNYGWPCFEGRQKIRVDVSWCDAMHAAHDAGGLLVEEPVHTYPHDGSGGSVTGGAIYTGSSYPAEYVGRFFFGDYAQRFFSTIDLDDPATAPLPLMSEEAAHSPVAIRTGPDGAIWWLGFGSGAPGAGELRRLGYDTCSTRDWSVDYYADSTMGGAPLAEACVSAAGAGVGAEAPPGLPEGYAVRWTRRAPLPAGTHRFTAQVTGSARLRVGASTVDRWSTGGAQRLELDHTLVQAEVTAVVLDLVPGAAGTAVLASTTVGAPPVVSVTVPANGVVVGRGTTVPFTAAAVDAEDGSLPASAITVRAYEMHYGESAVHLHPGAVTGATGSVVVDDAHAPGEIVWRLVASAADSSGFLALSAPVYVCVLGNEVGPCLP
ncbi:PQQ-dependent sugar dehydrogenase [Nocardioides sp. 1609]|uniref:PQQ-dependent sugar dehydrogenase n=1 Tax=Nocardioides sp. 1609 TaxID=2508327 RepID=UPI001430F2EA|nr:PQQ-dependent sugar dehydrogenase [Nocardioides sp. 1609]